jgi:hypothetical protein
MGEISELSAQDAVDLLLVGMFVLNRVPLLLLLLLEETTQSQYDFSLNLICEE